MAHNRLSSGMVLSLCLISLSLSMGALASSQTSDRIKILVPERMPVSVDLVTATEADDETMLTCRLNNRSDELFTKTGLSFTWSRPPGGGGRGFIKDIELQPGSTLDVTVSTGVKVEEVERAVLVLAFVENERGRWVADSEKLSKAIFACLRGEEYSLPEVVFTPRKANGAF